MFLPYFSDWIEKINELKTRLLRGKEVSEQINILGDDGVPVDYHVVFGNQIDRFHSASSKIRSILLML